MNEDIFKRLKNHMDADEKTMDNLYKKIKKLKQGGKIEVNKKNGFKIISQRVAVVTVIVLMIEVVVVGAVMLRGNKNKQNGVEMGKLTQNNNMLQQESLQNNNRLQQENLQNNNIWNMDMGITEVLADLTHDGIDEKITFTPKYDSHNSIRIQIINQQKEMIYFEKEIYEIPSDCYKLYVYETDGKQYILTYKPECSQSLCNYYFEVFSFDENGKKMVLDSSEVRFDTYNVKDNFDIRKIAEFYDKINVYLHNSKVLFINDANIGFFMPREYKVYPEEYNFIYDYDIAYGENDLMDEKLKKYYDFVVENICTDIE